MARPIITEDQCGERIRVSDTKAPKGGWVGGIAPFAGKKLTAEEFQRKYGFS